MMGLAYILAPRSGKAKSAQGCRSPTSSSGCNWAFPFPLIPSNTPPLKPLNRACKRSQSTEKMSRRVSLKLAMAASDTGESWVPGWLPPPLALAETDDGPSRGPFFFWFQKGLVMVTALQRLSKRSKSVSEPHLSLIDRPAPSEGRFQNSV